MFLGMIKRAATSMVEYETSDMPDKKLLGWEQKLIFGGMVEDPKIYDKLVKRIKREGYALEDRPIGDRSVDAAITWPHYRKEGSDKPVIFRSDLTRRRKAPWILAHELGHQYHIKERTPAGYVFGAARPVASQISYILAMLGALGLTGRRTAITGAGLGAAAFLGTLISEAKASANAKKIMEELTGEKQKIPAEIKKAYGTYVLATIPVVWNLVNAIKGRRVVPFAV